MFFDKLPDIVPNDKSETARNDKQNKNYINVDVIRISGNTRKLAEFVAKNVKSRVAKGAGTKRNDSKSAPSPSAENAKTVTR